MGNQTIRIILRAVLLVVFGILAWQASLRHISQSTLFVALMVYIVLNMLVRAVIR